MARSGLFDLSFALRIFHTGLGGKPWNPGPPLSRMLFHVYPRALLALPADCADSASLSTSATLPSGCSCSCIALAVHPLPSDFQTEQRVEAELDHTHPCPESFLGPFQVEPQSSPKLQTCTPACGCLGSRSSSLFQLLPDQQVTELQRPFSWKAPAPPTLKWHSFLQTSTRPSAPPHAVVLLLLLLLVYLFSQFQSLLTRMQFSSRTVSVMCTHVAPVPRTVCDMWQVLSKNLLCKVYVRGKCHQFASL